MTTGKSFVEIDCHRVLADARQGEHVSVMNAPPSSAPMSRPSIVTTGVSAPRSPCL